MIIFALMSAFEKVLETLAEQHGNTLGPWFDDLEAAALDNAKGCVGTGIPIEQEAALLGVGVNAVTGVFGTFRAKMTKTNK